MSRRKQKKVTNPKQTPNSYISSGKARLLPLGDCYINANWKEAGLANILIPRKHVTGNITYGVFLVDLLWKGVVGADVRFNAQEEDMQELLDAEFDWVPIDYTKAHNIIYGAEAFAADFDIKAHPDFALARMILEEDDDRIPIIDIEFGKDGKPFKVISINDQSDDLNDDLNDDDDDYDDDGYEYYDEGNDDPMGQDANQEEKEEVTHGSQTRAVNDDWQQKIRDADLTPLLSGWTRKQWEDFITGPKSQSPGDPFVDQVLLYVFDICFREVNPEPELDWNAVIEKSSSQFFFISSKPVQTDEYIPSIEEQNLYMECYQLIEEGSSVNFHKHYKQKLKQLLAGVERWPNNRLIYNALENIYMLSGEQQQLEATLQKTVTLFPDYLFALVNYATHQLRNGKSGLVPSIMKRAYTIKDLYPNRSEFHISEIFSFYKIWFEYFVQTKQLLKARHYRMQLLKNVHPDYSGMEKLSSALEQFDNICIVAIKAYLDQASKDPEFRKMMVDLLLEYGKAGGDSSFTSNN